MVADIFLLVDKIASFGENPPKTMTSASVPDGGYGWVVVFGFALSNVIDVIPIGIPIINGSCCVFQIFNNSLLSVFGLLFSDQLAALGLNTSGAALVLNINIIVQNLSGDRFPNSCLS